VGATIKPGDTAPTKGMLNFRIARRKVYRDFSPSLAKMPANPQELIWAKCRVERGKILD